MISCRSTKLKKKTKDLLLRFKVKMRCFTFFLLTSTFLTFLFSNKQSLFFTSFVNNIAIYDFGIAKIHKTINTTESGH